MVKTMPFFASSAPLTRKLSPVSSIRLSLGLADPYPHEQVGASGIGVPAFTGGDKGIQSEIVVVLQGDLQAFTRAQNTCFLGEMLIVRIVTVPDPRLAGGQGAAHRLISRMNVEHGAYAALTKAVADLEDPVGQGGVFREAIGGGGRALIGANDPAVLGAKRLQDRGIRPPDLVGHVDGPAADGAAQTVLDGLLVVRPPHIPVIDVELPLQKAVVGALQNVLGEPLAAFGHEVVGATAHRADAVEHTLGGHSHAVDEGAVKVLVCRLVDPSLDGSRARADGRHVLESRMEALVVDLDEITAPCLDAAAEIVEVAGSLLPVGRNDDLPVRKGNGVLSLPLRLASRGVKPRPVARCGEPHTDGGDPLPFHVLDGRLHACGKPLGIPREGAHGTDVHHADHFPELGIRGDLVEMGHVRPHIVYDGEADGNALVSEFHGLFHQPCVVDADLHGVPRAPAEIVEHLGNRLFLAEAQTVIQQAADLPCGLLHECQGICPLQAKKGKLAVARGDGMAIGIGAETHALLRAADQGLVGFVADGEPVGVGVPPPDQEGLHPLGQPGQRLTPEGTAPEGGVVLNGQIIRRIGNVCPIGESVSLTADVTGKAALELYCFKCNALIVAIQAHSHSSLQGASRGIPQTVS